MINNNFGKNKYYFILISYIYNEIVLYQPPLAKLEASLKSELVKFLSFLSKK